jgi:CheY-like chemotaxis protein
MSGVVSDVTDRRALQVQLERSERMASLGTLAAGLAHEINNPLAAVLANLESLQRELGAGAGPGVDELLAETRDGAERVRDVVRSLRTFARPGADGPRATDVRSEIDAAVRLTLNELRHHARLEVRVGDLPPVAASTHQLGQVFLNLLTNAAQAIPEGNADQHLITLEAATAPDGWARVEVRDSGAGIAPELLPRIFEPFFTTKAQGVGTGLGLAIVHSIVAAVGGRVEVESRLGSGTTFRVLLPPAPAATPPPEPVAAPVAGPGPKRRVLLVDDDALVARSLVRMLRHTHQVTVAASGAEALGRFDAGERYDAILCDLMMPQMSGPELHAQLARRDPALAARVVFVTGGAFTEGSTEFLRTTSNACLEKPVDQGELVAALDRAAAG